MTSNAASGCIVKISMLRLNIGSGMLGLSSCMLRLGLRLSIGSCMLRLGLRLSIGSCMFRLGLRLSIGSCMLRLGLTGSVSGSASEEAAASRFL